LNILAAVNPVLTTVCWLVCGLVWLIAVYIAPWRAFFAAGERQHSLLAAILALGCFWLLNVEVRESLALHPLAMTATVMVFGWALAIIGGALALLFSHGLDSLLEGALVWGNYPVDCVLSVVVPAGATSLVLHVIQRIRVRNLFIYMLGGGFLGAMISIQLMAAATVILLHITGATELAAMAEEHYMIFGLLMFPEGFINGAIVTLLTVLWPDIVKTYDDHRYLDDD